MASPENSNGWNRWVKTFKTHRYFLFLIQLLPPRRYKYPQFSQEFSCYEMCFLEAACGFEPYIAPSIPLLFNPKGNPRDLWKYSSQSPDDPTTSMDGLQDRSDVFCPYHAPREFLDLNVKAQKTMSKYEDSHIQSLAPQKDVYVSFQMNTAQSISTLPGKPGHDLARAFWRPGG